MAEHDDFLDPLCSPATLDIYWARRSILGALTEQLPNFHGTVLENMVRAYGSKVWSRYGFVDAFNPQTGWYSQWVLGIDLGIMLLMAENARTGSVWEAVMSTREAKHGMSAVGLKLRT